jgi:hypothetical protein
MDGWIMDYSKEKADRRMNVWRYARAALKYL